VSADQRAAAPAAAWCAVRRALCAVCGAPRAARCAQCVVRCAPPGPRAPCASARTHRARATHTHAHDRQCCGNAPTRGRRHQRDRRGRQDQHPGQRDRARGAPRRQQRGRRAAADAHRQQRDGRARGDAARVQDRRRLPGASARAVWRCVPAVVPRLALLRAGCCHTLLLLPLLFAGARPAHLRAQVGMGATLLDGVVMEPGSIVAAGAVVPPGAQRARARVCASLAARLAHRVGRACVRACVRAHTPPSTPHPLDDAHTLSRTLTCARVSKLPRCTPTTRAALATPTAPTAPMTGTKVGAGEIWAGAPARLLRHLSEDERGFVAASADNYAKLATEHRWGRVAACVVALCVWSCAGAKAWGAGRRVRAAEHQHACVLACTFVSLTFSHQLTPIPPTPPPLPPPPPHTHTHTPPPPPHTHAPQGGERQVV
jgi:carbonic anhydrase/acetyltransferase-like protein (isoleucine patch superfamily)